MTSFDAALRAAGALSRRLLYRGHPLPDVADAIMAEGLATSIVAHGRLETVIALRAVADHLEARDVY